MEHPVFVGQQGLRGLLLQRREGTVEGRLDRNAVVSLVHDLGSDSVALEQPDDLFQAAPGQSDSSGRVVGTRDDPGLVEGGEPHGLSPVVLRILEGRQSSQPAQHGRRQPFLFQIDPARLNDPDLVRQGALERLRGPPFGWRRGPRVLLLPFFMRQALPNTDDLPLLLRLPDGGIDRRGRHPLDAREEPPLIRVGKEVFVDKNAVAFFSRAPFERKGHETAEPSPGQGIQVGTQTIIDLHADLLPLFDRPGQEDATELPGHGGRDPPFEEDPHVCARARPKALHGHGDSHGTARVQEGGNGLLPVAPFKPDREEPAGPVRKERIEADRMPAGEMIPNRLVCHGRKPRVRTLAALHPRLAASGPSPFVGTGKRVAASAAFLGLPAQRVQVLSATEDPTKQGDLGLCRGLLGHGPERLGLAFNLRVGVFPQGPQACLEPGVFLPEAGALRQGCFELFAQASFRSLHRSLTRDILRRGLPVSPNECLILPVLPTRSMASLYKYGPGH